VQRRDDKAKVRRGEQRWRDLCLLLPIVSYSEYRRRQIKEIPGVCPRAQSVAPLQGDRDFPDFWTDLVHFILMGAPNGAPTGDHQADLTIVEPYT